MASKNKKNRIGSVIWLLTGLCCAAVLGAVFYGAMAYQLADAARQGAQPAAVQADVQLVLAEGELLSEETLTQRVGGQDCTAAVRTYLLEDGIKAQAITASPAAYIERLSEEGWTAQLITGFVLAGIDAVYSLRGEAALLCAREGDRIYMLEAPAQEELVYALGAAASLE